MNFQRIVDFIVDHVINNAPYCIGSGKFILVFIFDYCKNI